MDVERFRRTELIERLNSEFECFQEVWLRPILQSEKRVRADVVAVPRSEDLSNIIIAFEVKEPRQEQNFVKWTKAFRQAYDYVDAVVDDPVRAPPIAGLRVACAFVYPSPSYQPPGSTNVTSRFLRPGHEAAMAGVIHLALQFRVGIANIDEKSRLILSFGPNTIWQERLGFLNFNMGLVTGTRPLGSRRI